MLETLSPNTQAILLLTAPLMGGRGAAPSELLKLAEYNALARHLRDIKRQPADFLGEEAEDLLQLCQSVVDAVRLRWLLGRVAVLEQTVKRWQSHDIWVVSRADADYPRRFKSHLREESPPIIYGCGDNTLLDSGGLAVVGSRHMDDALVDDAMAVSRLAAQAGKTLVSGGAQGIDQIAMHGAFSAGGQVSAVLADSLEKTAKGRDYRRRLGDGRLVLISPYDPNATFNASLATRRNKLIYALADAALVLNASFRKGSTWAGAVEQLDKLNLVPVYVRATGEASASVDALCTKGAMVWPNPRIVTEFETALDVNLPAQRGLAI
ncbi:DNA-processing protein DprA [Azohydromonas lata]|uniref:DNA-processing protein DprA n=1 Tax=Azohydromonas lata TaxID=45677 RepID=UPI000831BBFE|nr:DNA-processing protein DprA [Azohydromonas lata]